MASGEIGRSLEDEAGVFAGDGNGRQERAGLTTAGSVTWTVIRRLDVTGSFSIGRTGAVDSDPPNGFEGRTSTGYRFFERLYVDGLRTRFGADANWRRGPWRVTAEMLRVSEARDGQGLDLEDLPTLIGFGWSSAVTREFGRRSGANRSRLHEWDAGSAVRLARARRQRPANGERQRPSPRDRRARARWTHAHDRSVMELLSLGTGLSGDRSRSLHRGALGTGARQVRRLLVFRHAPAARASVIDGDSVWPRHVRAALACRNSGRGLRVREKRTRVRGRSAFRYVVQIAIPPQVDVPVDECCRRIEAIVERVPRQHFERGPVAEHHGGAVTSGDVHTALRSHW